MSFSKKSKTTASVGATSPKILQKSKSARVTKSEVKVDTQNNNSQESLEQNSERKVDMESKYQYLHSLIPFQAGPAEFFL